MSAWIRALLIGLVLLNVGLVIALKLDVDGLAGADLSQREPQRMERQFQPQAIRLNPPALPLAPAASAP